VLAGLVVVPLGPGWVIIVVVVLPDVAGAELVGVVVVEVVPVEVLPGVVIVVELGLV